MKLTRGMLFVSFLVLVVGAFLVYALATTSVVITSTSGSTSQALDKDNITITTITNDGVTRFNITDWRKGGQSIAWLNFQFEADGKKNATDYTAPKQTNGTVTSATWHKGDSASYGGYYAFIGGSYVNIVDGAETDLYDNFTILMIVNPATTQGANADLYSKHNGAYLMESTGTGNEYLVGWSTDGASYNCAAANFLTLTANQWQKVAIIKKGLVANHYINGKKVSSCTGTTSRIQNNANSLKLGRWSQSDGRYWKGNMSQFILINYSLSVQQMLLWNETAGTNTKLSSNETSLGQVWSVNVCPANTTTTGTCKTSNNITIVTNIFPVVTNVILNSTRRTNLTTANLTVYWTSTDAEGQRVVNITDWRRNGSSIAFINTPFEPSGLYNGTSHTSGYQNNLSQPQGGAIYNKNGGYKGTGGYYFDGVDDYISYKKSLNLSTRHSIEFWVNLSAITGDGAILSKWNHGADHAWFIYEAGANTINWFIASSATDSGNFASFSGAMPANKWHHVVALYNGSAAASDRVFIYINGVKKTGSITGVIPSSVRLSNAEMRLGKVNTLNWDFNGWIDNVVIYNRILSRNEILRHNLTDYAAMVSEETTIGDIWKSCITPNDGVSDGLTVCSNNVTIIAVTTKPIVFDKYPRNASVFNLTNKIIISVNVTDDIGVSQVKVNITRPGGNITRLRLLLSTANRYNRTFTIPNITGLYNVSFDANDTSNNHNASVRTQFRANDRIRPNVFDAYPRNGTRYNYSSTVTISINATDNVAVSQVFANLTGRNGIFSNIRLKRDGVTNKYNNTYSLGLTRGRYNITFLVNDTSNNKNFTVKRYFNVSDGVKPLVVAVYPIGLTFNVQTKIDIKANISDIYNVSTAYANITKPSGSIDRLTLRVSSTTFWNNTYDIPFLPGRYFVRFIANDTSNNINRTVIINFTAVDPATPSTGGPGAPSAQVIYADLSLTPSMIPNTIGVGIQTQSILENVSAVLSPQMLIMGVLVSGLILATKQKKKVTKDSDKDRRKGAMESEIE